MMQSVRVLVMCCGIVLHDSESNTNQGNTFFRAALGGTRTHDTQLSRQSAFPTELPGQLSRQGSKTTVLWHRKPSLNM